MITSKLHYETVDINELSTVLSLLEEVKQNMQINNLHAWDDDYPNKDFIENDINQKTARKVTYRNDIIAYIDILDPIEFEIIMFPEKTISFARVMVKPQYQKIGIATYMINELIKEVKQKGYNYIGILVDNDNYPAVKLYTSLGFKPIGPETFEFGTMEKYLKEI